jgi:predicted nucleic acid-binding protein
LPVFDASFIVSSLVTHDENFGKADQFLRNSFRPGDRWIVPSIALTEVIAAVTSVLKNVELASRTMQPFIGSDRLVLYDIGMTRAERAGVLAAQLGMKACDAIYVALAQEVGEPLVTFDRQQAARAQGVISVIVPANEEPRAPLPGSAPPSET